MKLLQLLDQIGGLRWSDEETTHVYVTDPANYWRRVRVRSVFRDSDGDIIIVSEENEDLDA